MRHQTLNFRLVTGFVLSLLLAITPEAIADYVPLPTQKPPTDYSKSGGTRGGCSEDKIPLTILAPKEYVGETTSLYPTFAWFVSNSDKVTFLLFMLDQKGDVKQIGQPITKQSSSGINKYSLPENQPGLAVGQKYLWQVSIRCVQGDLIEAAEFRVVQPRQTLSNKLSRTKDELGKVELYAEDGLWYNALEEALKLDKKPGKVVTNLLQDLAKSEEPNAKQTLTNVKRQNIQKHIDDLRQISSHQP